MNTPSFLKLGARDASAATAFFADLFGWRFTPMEQGGVFDTGGPQIGVHGDDGRPALIPYFAVEDIDSAVSRVRALGGHVEDKIADEPGFGRFANCVDPQGVRFGLHQPIRR